jgi:hypothetical protein
MGQRHSAIRSATAAPCEYRARIALTASSESLQRARPFRPWAILARHSGLRGGRFLPSFACRTFCLADSVCRRPRPVSAILALCSALSGGLLFPRCPAAIFSFVLSECCHPRRCCRSLSRTSGVLGGIFLPMFPRLIFDLLDSSCFVPSIRRRTASLLSGVQSACCFERVSSDHLYPETPIPPSVRLVSLQPACL